MNLITYMDSFIAASSPLTRERSARRPARRAFPAAVFALAAVMPSSARALDPDEEAFVLGHRCEVVETLQAIHATPMETE